MRVAVFRARDDGLRTAERLREMGHEPVLAPVFDVVPTNAVVPAGDFAAVIFTSAHGVQGLRPDEAQRLSARPCFCVGRRTAECAEAAGFGDRYVGRADADCLTDLVAAAVRPPASLLLIAGRDRKPAIETRLGAAGYMVSVAEIYEARGRARWPGTDRAALAAGILDAALHYSRRSATLALACAEAAGLQAAMARARHHCLSLDAASPLIAASFQDVVISSEPNEDSLLSNLS